MVSGGDIGSSAIYHKERASNKGLSYVSVMVVRIDEGR